MTLNIDSPTCETQTGSQMSNPIWSLWHGSVDLMQPKNDRLKAKNISKITQCRELSKSINVFIFEWPISFYLECSKGFKV